MKKFANGTVRGRLSDGAPNPIDVHVGQRLHLRRTILHMSQERLAEELGLTFQQVQKYEKGLNRIGASRLWDIAQVLGVNIDYFYQNMDQNSMENSPRKISPHQGCSEDVPEIDMDAWLKDDVVALVKSYLKIKDKNVQQNILSLVQSMAPVEEERVFTDADDAALNPPDYVKNQHL